MISSRVERLRKNALTAAAVVISLGNLGCGDGGSSSGAPCTALRIAGGEECEVRPLAIAVVASDLTYCSGAFITPRHVLTAAHCIPPSGQTLVVATKGFSVRARSAVRHPQYSSIGFSPFDVAVVTIDENAPVSPVPIDVSSTIEAGDQVVAYGYGIDQNGEDVVERVQGGGSSLKATYLNVTRVGADSIETISDGSGDTCQGDSGGPILFQGGDGQYGIVAVVRSGPNTCEPDIGIPGDNSNLQENSITSFVARAAPGAQFK